MRLSLKIIALLNIVLLACSCSTVRDVAYLQDIDGGSSESVDNNFSPKIKSDDMISIVISSSKPELAMPYNLWSVREGLIENQTLRPELESYQVDKDGTIQFPILGQLKVEGLTRSQLSEMIKEKVANVVPKAVVTVAFVNFKVTVLGEVMRPGSVNVKGDRITILDAIGEAGDLSVYGKRENIMIIREQDGKREIARVNLKSRDLFKSPYYYLQQNDVVYVEPNKTKAQSGSSFRTNFPLFVSAGSLLITVATLIVTLTK